MLLNNFNGLQMLTAPPRNTIRDMSIGQFERQLTSLKNVVRIWLMSTDLYTLADLVKAIGTKRRTVQLWAEAGVIQAHPDSERAGSGTHRQFGVDEIVIGCIINAFASNGMTIGKLLIHSRQLRVDLATSAGIRREIRQAIDGDTRVYLSTTGLGTIIFATDETSGAMPIALGHLNKGNPSLIVVYLNACLANAGTYLR